MSIIGIDLGTTNCCVSVLRNNVPEVIANEIGNRTTPSSIAFTDAEVLVGEPAQRQAMDNPANTVYDIKKLIGAKFSDPTVQSMKRSVPFTIKEGSNNTPVVVCKVKGKNKEYTVTALVVMLLEKMKSVAEGFLGTECNHCVLSVPALFTEEQKAVYEKATKMAKLTVLKYIKEPVAAAIAYGIDEDNKDSSKVVVFDCGGKTCDVSVIAATSGMMMLKKTTTNLDLGGDHFDALLVKHFASEFERKNKVKIQGPEGDVRAIKKLTSAIQRAKKILTSQASADIECESLFKGKDFFVTLSRARMEQITSGLCTDVKNAVKKCLDDVEGSDYTHLILAGGSSQLMKTRENVVDLLPSAKVLDTIQPEEVVAYGCAIQASILVESKITKVVEAKEHSVPTLAGSIVVETEDGIATKVLAKGTSLPCTASCTFAAANNDQKDIFVQVYEGERTLCKHNVAVAQFAMPLLSKTPKNRTNTSITFSVSVEGALTINKQDEKEDSKNIIVVPCSSASPSPAGSSTPASSITHKERVWDQAVLSWATKKQAATIYTESIVVGMINTGTLKALDPDNTVGKACAQLSAYLTTTHSTVVSSKIDDVAVVAEAVTNAGKQQADLASLVEQVLMGGNKNDDESDDSDEGDETEEESEDEALD